MIRKSGDLSTGSRAAKRRWKRPSDGSFLARPSLKMLIFSRVRARALERGKSLWELWFSFIPILKMSISVHTYTYQGQVYSPAFSDVDPSEAEESSSDESDCSPLPPPSSNPPQHLKRRLSTEVFVSKRPRFANKYEEMLQPLSPVTTLPCRSVPVPVPVKVNEKLQRQFESVINQQDVPAIDDFLSCHSSDININYFNADGRTALQESCMEGNLALAQVLIKYGAETRITTRDGFSTLQLAAFSGHSPLLLYILSQRNLVK